MGFMRPVPEGASRIFKVELFRSKGIARALIVGFAQIFREKRESVKTEPLSMAKKPVNNSRGASHPQKNSPWLQNHAGL
jgi:hypothetical protein